MVDNDETERLVVVAAIELLSEMEDRLFASARKFSIASLSIWIL